MMDGVHHLTCGIIGRDGAAQDALDVEDRGPGVDRRPQLGGSAARQAPPANVLCLPTGRAVEQLRQAGCPDGYYLHSRLLFWM